MPSSSHNTPPRKAAKLAKLGKILSELKPDERIEEFMARASFEKRFSSLSIATVKTARELRQAYRAFGHDLEEFLRTWGTARIYLLAKFLDGPTIAKAGTIRVPGEREDRRLEDVSKVQLQYALQGRERVAGQDRGLARLPGDLFMVPDDLEQIFDFLHRRMKSLLHFDNEVGPRLRIRSRPARVIDRMERILKAYLELIEYLKASPEPLTPSGRREVRPQSTPRTAGRRYVRGHLIELASLVKTLKEVPDRGRVPPRSRRPRRRTSL